MADKNTIKNWFRTNLKPTQSQFWATWDSFWHKDEKIPITAIDDIENILADKADSEVLTNHLTNATAHADLFTAKEDKNKRGVALGYAPLDQFAKLATDYLNVVNDLVTGGTSSVLTAEQGKLLQIQITAINTLLTSDNVNLDNVQEIVDAIETVQTSLSTILVNDLTTGGTTKALTAEMGKTLKGLIDALATTVSNLLITITTPTLQEVLTAGSTADLSEEGFTTILLYNNIEQSLTELNSGSFKLKYNNTNGEAFFENTADLSSYNQTFDIGGAITSGNVTIIPNVESDVTKIFSFPDKPSGIYTLATTEDLPTLFSGTYIPTVSSSSNCVSPGGLSSTYSVVGDIVTAIIVLSVAGYNAANMNTSITFNLPIPRTNNSILNIGNGTSYSANSEYWSLIAQTPAGNNDSSIVYFKPTSISGGNQIITIQYSLN